MINKTQLIDGVWHRTTTYGKYIFYINMHRSLYREIEYWDLIVNVKFDGAIHTAVQMSGERNILKAIITSVKHARNCVKYWETFPKTPIAGKYTSKGIGGTGGNY